MKRLWKWIAVNVLMLLYADEPAPGAASALAQPPAPAPGAAAPAPGAPAPGAPAPTPAWYDTFKNDELKGWIKSQNNGIPDAETAALKAWNLEKLLGADKAGRGVVVPKPEASKEEWAEFWKKTGQVPEKPEGYALPKDMDPKAVEALSKDPMLAKFQQYAHSINMPPQFFGSVLSWFAKESASMLDTRDADFDRKSSEEVEALKKEWVGDAWNQNVEYGRRAARIFVPHSDPKQLEETITRIEGALGTAATYKLFANIGKAMAEDKFIQGEAGGRMGGGMSPEAAKLKISELRKDAEWTKRFTAGGAAEKQEWDRLHTIAYQQQQA